MTESERIKIVLIGESGVGKTNLIQVAMGKPFQRDTESTISSSYFEGDIIINNKQYMYALWDTAGQEIYRSLNKLFINGSKIILVVFAINDKRSFEEVDFWVNYVKETLGEEKYIMALVGNKSDLFEEQQVSEEEIMKKGEKINIRVIITSAAEDAGGFRLFLESLLKEYINKTEQGIELDDRNYFSLKYEKEEEKNESKNEIDRNGKGKIKKKKKKNVVENY